MKTTTIKAGQAVKVIGAFPNKPIILKAGTSRAVPITRFEILEKK
jgi:hypothetical protein